MNTIALVIVLLSGQEMLVNGYLTAEECFAKADVVIAMEETINYSYVYSIDCTWFKTDNRTWRIAFGEKI